MPAAGPGSEFLWTEIYHDTHLYEREMRAANAATHRSGPTGPDETSDALRKQAQAAFNKMITNPAKCSQDPSRTQNILRRIAAIMALDRMLTCPTGFRLDTVDDPVAHLRLHATSAVTPPESFDLRVLDKTGMAAIPGHFSLHGRPPGDTPRYDARHGVSEVHFDHAAHLLMQEVRSARPRAPLVQDAETLLEDVLNAPDAHGADPTRTNARLLRFTVLLVAERMLSHRLGVRHADLPGPNRCARIFVPEDRHPPESFEIRLPPVPEPR